MLYKQQLDIKIVNIRFWYAWSFLILSISFVQGGLFDLLVKGSVCNLSYSIPSGTDQIRDAVLEASNITPRTYQQVYSTMMMIIPGQKLNKLMYCTCRLQLREKSQSGRSKWCNRVESCGASRSSKSLPHSSQIFLHIDIDSDSDKSGEELYTVYGRIETRGFFI